MQRIRHEETSRALQVTFCFLYLTNSVKYTMQTILRRAFFSRFFFFFLCVLSSLRFSLYFGLSSRLNFKASFLFWVCYVLFFFCNRLNCQDVSFFPLVLACIFVCVFVFVFLMFVYLFACSVFVCFLCICLPKFLHRLRAFYFLPNRRGWTSLPKRVYRFGSPSSTW